MSDFPRPIATVDIVPVRLHDYRLQIGSIVRNDRTQPECGRDALPGGYVHVGGDADLAEAARRIVATKTGLEAMVLEQVGAVGNGRRDPRGWSISLFYLGLVRDGQEGMLKWHDAASLPPLAFDHSGIVRIALQRLRDRSVYSALPLLFLPPEFTVNDAQRVYETIFQERMDKANFRRKVLATTVIEPTGAYVAKPRPTALFRLANITGLEFPRPIIS